LVNASVLITGNSYLSGDISLQYLLALMGDTLRGVAATFMALGWGCGLAWNTFPHPGAMMIFYKQDRQNIVTLSEAKGLSRWAEMLRFAQHDNSSFAR